MRTYVPGTWEISKDRYLELLHFCRQYSRWKVEAASMIGVSAQQYATDPHGSEPGDPTGRAVERREDLMAMISTVESCAAAVDGGRWYQALILNICNGTGYEAIRYLYPGLLKNSDRNAFFRARRMFFNLLDKARK